MSRGGASVTATAIQVVVLRPASDRDTDAYARTIRSAFDSSGIAGTYLDGALNTGVPVLIPQDPTGEDFKEHHAAAMLDAAVFTVMVVLQPSVANPKLRSVVEDLSSHHSARIGLMEYYLPRKIELTDVQQAAPSDRVREQDLQQPQLAFEVLQQVRLRLLEYGLKRGSEAQGGGRRRKTREPTLFLSHAKIDGIPTALSLLNLVMRLRFRPKNEKSKKETSEEVSRVYYDAVDIKPGENWQKELLRHSSSSVMIALRTEAYETRTWCRKEYLQAETHGMPIVVVDLRTQQHHRPERLPFGRATTVRIHDGNLLRVLVCALTADVRLLRIEALVAELLRRLHPRRLPPFVVLPHAPSELSLAGARAEINRRAGSWKLGYVIYPEPALHGVHATAARSILGQSDVRIRFYTLAELRQRLLGKSRHAA
ncbi:MAG: hypothetical protein AAGA68_19905 [Pseudomonadota bacterium]